MISMMNCRNCGYKTREGDKFCQDCGCVVTPAVVEDTMCEVSKNPNYVSLLPMEDSKVEFISLTNYICANKECNKETSIGDWFGRSIDVCPDCYLGREPGIDEAMKITMMMNIAQMKGLRKGPARLRAEDEFISTHTNIWAKEHKVIPSAQAIVDRLPPLATTRTMTKGHDPLTMLEKVIGVLMVISLPILGVVLNV